MFGGRPSLRSAQKGHTTFLDPETLSLLRSGPRNCWEGLLIGDWVGKDLRRSAEIVAHGESTFARSSTGIGTLPEV